MGACEMQSHTQVDLIPKMEWYRIGYSAKLKISTAVLRIRFLRLH